MTFLLGLTLALVTVVASAAELRPEQMAHVHVHRSALDRQTYAELRLSINGEPAGALEPGMQTSYAVPPGTVRVAVQTYQIGARSGRPGVLEVDAAAGEHVYFRATRPESDDALFNRRHARGTAVQLLRIDEATWRARP